MRPHRARRRAAARGHRRPRPAPTPRDRRAGAAGRRGGAAGADGGPACGSAWSRELSGDGYEPGVQARFAEAVELLRGLGRRGERGVLPALRATRCRPTTSSRRARRRSNLARFDAVRYGLRVGDDGERGLEEVMALTRAQGFGAGGQAPHHPRHVRAVQRLLRRLLRAGAEGPHPDHPRLPARSRRRRAGQPDPPTWRSRSAPARRPARDVPAGPRTIPSNLYGGRRCRCPAGCPTAAGRLQVMAPTLRDDLLTGSARSRRPAAGA